MEIGKKVTDVVKDKQEKIKTLQSLITKENNKRTRYNMKKRCFLLRTKIKNVVSDFHWKISNFLVTNFSTIIIPKFETHDMVQKKDRTLNKTSVNNLSVLSHYKFLEKLKIKCIEHKRLLFIVNESYTSKTCGCCGTINNSSSSETFKCSNCNIMVDRDFNGARNILIRTLNTLNKVGVDTLR